MKLLKISTLILCVSASGCSMLGQQKAEAPAKPEKPVAASHWWWPFGAEEKAKSAKVAKVDVKATQAWLDQYEPRLRESLKDSRMEVERRENVLVVTMPVDPSFNPDRPSMLMPAVLGPITKVAKLVEGDTRTAVLVLGHADASGKDDANRKLSQERAQAVAAIFRMSGLQRDRLYLKGLSSDMPRAANDSQQGRSLNRRVEMVLTPQATLVALIAQYNTPAKPAQPAKAEQVVAADQTK